MRKLREMLFRWRWYRAHRNWKDTRQKRKAYRKALMEWRGEGDGNL